MLFCYPAAAPADNWVHDCIVTMVQSALEAMNSGNPVEAWPECIPAANREPLSGRPKFRELFEGFVAAAAPLTNDQRALVWEVVESQNSIPVVFDGVTPCESIDAIPDTLREPVKSLFKYGFQLLSDLGIRDHEYKRIYDWLDHKVCPFCGCEYFDAPGAPRHDLDHYLLVSKYPFAGCNLRNLAPMGDRCNSSYKLQQDVIVDSAGNKRACFDPYGVIHASLSLVASNPFGAIDPTRPDWMVDLGGLPEAATWDAVWKISQRYKTSVLDADYRHWLREFATWWRGRGDPNDQSTLSGVLATYLEATETQGFSDRAFIKRAVFEMISHRVENGPEANRLIDFLQEVARNEGDAA